MTLRVAFDARPLDLDYLRSQGIGRYTAALLEALQPVAAEHGGELLALRSRPQADSPFLAGQRTIRSFPLTRPRLPERAAVLAEQLLLRRDLSRARADVLHAPSIFRLSLAPGIPTVVTIHDLIPLLFASDYLRSGLLYRLMFGAARRATLILAVSERTAVDAEHQLGVPADRIVVVPGAADERFRPVTDESVQRRLGISSPYVLYVGGLAGRDPRKAVDELIGSFAAWRRERARAEVLVLTGRVGPATAPLRDRARQTGAEVIFTGFVADADLPALYSGARCLVTASRYEGFGLPPLEALACGTPVAAYQAGALPEIAGPGALLVPTGDAAELMRAVERLCDDRELRERLSEAGRSHAATFSWRRSAELAWGAYQRAAHSSCDDRRT